MSEPKMDVMLAPSCELVFAPMHALVHLECLMIGHFIGYGFLDGVRSLLHIFRKVFPLDHAIFLLHVMLDYLWMLACCTANLALVSLFCNLLLKQGHSQHHVPFLVVFFLFVVAIDQFHLVIFTKNDVFFSFTSGVSILVLG